MYVRNYYFINNQLFIIGGGEMQKVVCATKGDPTTIRIDTTVIIPLKLPVGVITPQRLQLKKTI